jgi:hypothetical protein
VSTDHPHRLCRICDTHGRTDPAAPEVLRFGRGPRHYAHPRCLVDKHGFAQARKLIGEGDLGVFDAAARPAPTPTRIEVSGRRVHDMVNAIAARAAAGVPVIVVATAAQERTYRRRLARFLASTKAAPVTYERPK